MAKMLAKNEELALGRAWSEERSERARSRLVAAYEPLIRSIARKYVRPGLDIDDLYQEGVIGFMGALDNFDPDLGYGVGTLARFHIAARIQLHVSEFAGMVRLPNSRKIKGLVSGCVVKIRIAESEKGSSLSASEKSDICKKAGFSLQDLEQFEMVMRPAKSLSQPQSDEEGASRLDLADETETAQDVIKSRSIEQAGKIIADLLADLPPRTAEILRKRHLSGEFMALDDLAAELGISRERVRRIEIKALQDLRMRLAEIGVGSSADLA